MCEDSRAERRYWKQRVERLQRQMEQEDLERRQAESSVRSGPGEPEPLPIRTKSPGGIARGGWASRLLGQIYSLRRA